MRSSTRRPASSPPPGRPRGGTRKPGAAREARPSRPEASRPQHWFAERLLLILSGQLPVHSMLGHVGAAAYEQLIRLAADAPLWPDREGGASRPTLRQVGAFSPATGVIEAFARIALDEERLRALAFRLEYQRDGLWCCAAVDIGPQQRQRAARS